MSNSAKAYTRDATSDSITKALTWLKSEQNADGSWGTNYQIAQTAFAVLNFETYAVEQGISPFDDSYEYSQQVKTGLDYIFANTLLSQ